MRLNKVECGALLRSLAFSEFLWWPAGFGSGVIFESAHRPHYVARAYARPLIASTIGDIGRNEVNRASVVRGMADFCAQCCVVWPANDREF
jgi:hypothetical protein